MTKPPPSNESRKIHIDHDTYYRLVEEMEKGSFRNFNDTLRHLFKMQPYLKARQEQREKQEREKGRILEKERHNTKIAVKYKHSRLCFLRDKIDPLEDDDYFQVETAKDGTFVFSKKDFNEKGVFFHVTESESYSKDGIYHYPKPPRKALRFKIK